MPEPLADRSGSTVIPGSIFLDWTVPGYGQTYFYSYDILDLPLSVLTNGANTVSFFATSMGHGIELLWPGPSILVKYQGSHVLPPAPPALASPPNNTTNASRTPLLRWRTSSTATAYHLVVATDNGFSSIVFSDNSLADTTHQLGQLDPFTTYYWHVRAMNGTGWSAFSSTWTFTTLTTPPSAVVLSAPSDNATSQSVKPTLRWLSTDGATSYWLQVGTSNTFASGDVFSDSTLADTATSLRGLSNNTKYYWHVRAKNAGGAGGFSPTWSFTTIVPVPGALTLVTPVNNASVSRDTVKCVWRTTSPSSSKYWFEVSTDSLFVSSTSVDSALTDTTKVVRTLLNNRPYYWRVRGGNAGGWGPFSERRRFAVSYTAIRDQYEVPGTFVLNQNYPNPFNPSSQIEFGIPKETRVKLEVYDVLGARVLTLEDGIMSAGYHSVTVQLVSLPSGLYLYRLTTPDVSLTRKMLLMK